MIGVYCVGVLEQQYCQQQQTLVCHLLCAKHCYSKAFTILNHLILASSIIISLLRMNKLRHSEIESLPAFITKLG